MGIAATASGAGGNVKSALPRWARGQNCGFFSRKAGSERHVILSQFQSLEFDFC